MALSWTNYSYRRWLRQHGMYEIVKGALRPAAHQALSFEHPYFDGDSRIHRSEGMVGEPILQLQPGGRVLAVTFIRFARSRCATGAVLGATSEPAISIAD